MSNLLKFQSGITYYAPQTQPPPRPILPQRRPTNAIPILAPPERAGGKGRNRNANQQFDDFEDDGKTGSTVTAPIGSPENIDHILDNMFVQRAPFQPPSSVRKSNSPAPSDATGGNKADGEQFIIDSSIDIDAAILVNQLSALRISLFHSYTIFLFFSRTENVSA